MLELEQQVHTVQSQNLKLFDQNEIAQLEQRLREEGKVKEAELISCTTELEVVKNQLNNERMIVAELEKKVNLMENEVLKYKNEVKVTRQQLESNQINQERVKETLDTDLLTLK
jgi:hypothetical protein